MSSSFPRRPWLYPALAISLGLVLTLEMFATQLFTVLLGTENDFRTLLTWFQTCQYYAIPLLNLALSISAGLYLTHHAPALEPRLRSTLMSATMGGSALFGMSATLWWLAYASMGEGYSSPPAWARTTWDPMIPAVLFHGAVAIGSLSWFSQRSHRLGRPLLGQRARAAAWGVTIAIVCWLASSEDLRSPAPLLAGLTAMLYATAQSARSAGTAKERLLGGAPEEAKGPSL